MCISFLFTNPGEGSIKYKLILLNNRDEFYERKTQKATLFDDENLFTIYGTDLAAVVKGTWLGISENNGIIRIGNLANVTGEDAKGKLGRGPIVTDWIKSTGSIEEFNENLHSKCQDYGSFNLLSVEIKSDDIKTFYVSNRPTTAHAVPLGFSGLGNSPLGAPFKKVEAGTSHFQKLLESHKDKSKEDLIEASLNLLKDKTKYFPDPELFSRQPEFAEHFSSIHFSLPNHGYGTRTRTVILVDENDNIDYIEETMTSEDPNGEWERTHLKIPKQNTNSN